MLQIVHKNTSSFFKNAITKYSISQQRQELLIAISNFISEQLKKKPPVYLNFIDENNSRISQLLQVWSAFAIQYFNLQAIHSFSGGITVSSVHKNTIKSLQKLGFKFQLLDFFHQNSSYIASSKNFNEISLVFSKSIYNPANISPYITIMVCENPIDISSYIQNSLKTFHLEYPNPTTFDATLYQSEKYAALNLQIAAETYFLFKKIDSFI